MNLVETFAVAFALGFIVGGLSALVICVHFRASETGLAPQRPPRS